MTLDLSSDRAICTQTVTINPLEDDSGCDPGTIVQELPEILLQVHRTDDPLVISLSLSQLGTFETVETGIWATQGGYMGP